MEHSVLRSLFAKYMEGSLSRAEYEQLASAAQEQTAGDWEAALAPLIEQTEGAGVFQPEEWETVIRQILQQKPGSKVVDMPGRSFRPWKWVAAAAIILLAGSGAYFMFFDKSKPQSGIVQTDTKDVKAPTTNRAMITLADGSQVPVDSLTTLTQNNVALTKTAEGQLIYNGSTTETVYNTLTNPRGSTVIDMILADGSRVWLNAGSSVTYPVAFAGAERKVTVTGEAYFEVAASPNPSKGGALRPFIVEKGDMSVQVLGTHFNVNAYEDEADIRVTLLEGSVRVNKGAEAQLLRPGQQARINGSVQVVNGVDLAEITAWKEGRFYFEGATLQTILRQASRWYDVEIEYRDSIQQLFVAKLPRDLPVSELLQILELTKLVHFQVEGKKIIVTR